MGKTFKDSKKSRLEQFNKRRETTQRSEEKQRKEDARRAWFQKHDEDYSDGFEAIRRKDK